MLSYVEFEKYINLIKEYYDKDDQLTKIMKVEGFICYSGPVIDAMIELLEEVMGDKENKWINYWCWECSFGTDGKEKVTNSNGDYIQFESIKDLYFFLLPGRKNS